MQSRDFEAKLKEVGLRITPQRLAVMEAICFEDSHPSIDEIIRLVQQDHPHIAKGTIYSMVELFAEKGIIARFNSDIGVMRFDAESNHHHHLVEKDRNKIKDYFDEELDQLLHAYFDKKQIEGFDISSIKIEIQGKFNS